MLPKDVVGVCVPREAVRISGWAPFVTLRVVEPPPDGPPERSTLARNQHEPPLDRAA
jgi:hypothetical protein